MDPKNDPKPGQPPPAEPATPLAKKRFRIEKLEERIAPKKGGNGTNNCPADTLNSCSGTLPY
jgi:hypothetical protein